MDIRNGEAKVQIPASPLSICVASASHLTSTSLFQYLQSGHNNINLMGLWWQLMGFTLVVKSIGQELAGLNSNLAFSLITDLGRLFQAQFSHL